MSDYISREAALAQCKRHNDYTGWSIADGIEAIPAADVEPVRHGRWGKKQGGFWEFANCSVCGQKTPTVGIPPNYCPNCGAKMKMEEKPKGEKN